MLKKVTINNRDFYFSFREGEVMAVNKHSTTNVVGHGGGGRISTDHNLGVSGNIKDISITSKIDTEIEVWLKDCDDVETRIALRNTDIPCRQGHRVAFVDIGDDSTRYISTFINFNAKTITRFLSDSDLFEIFNIRDIPVKTKRVGLGRSIAAFLGCTVAGIAGSLMIKGGGPVVFVGIVAGFFIAAALTKLVEIPREPGYVDPTKAFAGARDDAEKWAMTNLYDPKNADFSYLTTAPQDDRTP